MERLTTTRPVSAESEKCLPEGEGLPSWSSLPLYSKFPMVRVPRGSFTLCTTMMCEPKHKSLDFEFDLSDPYCHVISNEYQPLHDPHLRHHFSSPKMRRHLERNGFITNEGKVICNLKEFNQYRQYLRKIYLLEKAREGKGDCQESMTSEEKEGPEIKSKVDIRGEEVRARLRQLREDTKSRVEKGILDKSERLKRRLEEINQQNALREKNRKLEHQKKMQSLQRHQSEIERQNRMLIRNWRIKDRQRLERLEEQRRQRILQQQQKSSDAWETRKAAQRERIDREEMAWQREEDRRQRNLTDRERMVYHQRRRLRASLDRLREQARREYLENEERHAKRLARRLALITLQNKRSRHVRYKSDRRYYRSLWSLEESLRRLSLADIPFPGQRSSVQFLQLLNDAIDEAVDIIADEEMEMATEEEEIHLRAQQIVQYVITKVQEEVYPLYLQMREEEEREEEGEVVRFRHKDSMIPPGERAVDRSLLKSVHDHIPTPVASPYAMSKSTELSSTSVKSKLLENLLTRLIDDLDNNRLNQDELLRLTKNVMALVLADDQSRTLQVTDDLVKFTLEKILNDLRSGKIPQEEVTDLTVTILGKEGSSEEDSMFSISSNDTQLNQYIEDTLQNVVQEGDLRAESPVNDAMLDEWILSQLKEITDDVVEGRLSKHTISEMVEHICGEMDGDTLLEDNDVSLRNFLERLIAELVGDREQSLYKIVHAVIASFHSHKSKSMKEFLNILKFFVDRVRTEIMSGQIRKSEVDLPRLENIVRHFSGAMLNHKEIAFFMNGMVLGEDESSAASMPVEHILDDTRRIILAATLEQATLLANNITAVCKDIAFEKEKEEDETFLRNISTFIVDILRLTWKSVKQKGFNAKDLEELTELFNIAIQTSKYSTAKGTQRSELLIKHIDEILRSLENGKFSESEIHDIGRSLVSCGNKLLQSDFAKISSQSLSSGAPSLTSTALAEDVVNHLLYSLQNEIQRGEVTKESVKELALCILNSKTSQASVESVLESVSAQKHTSPCDSQTAEHFVRETISEIMRDIESRSLYENEVSSMAVSIAATLSNTTYDEDAKRFAETANEIIRVLKDDEVPPYDLKRVFAVIMEQYSAQMFRDPFPNSQAVTSDSLLAESVIKEALNKVERDIASGQLSDDDIKSLMDQTIQSSMSKFKAPADVVNMTLAVLQQLQFDINAHMIPLDDVLNFLQTIGKTTDTKDDTSLNNIRICIRNIMSDIRKKKTKSEYLRNIIKHFSDSEKSTLRNVPAGRDPVKVLQHVLEHIDSDILTSFVRMTVRSVFQEFSMKEYKRKHVPTQDESEMDLQAASSQVASRVVSDLIDRIEHSLKAGDKLLSGEELQARSSEVRKRSLQQFESVPSKEIGILILDTLNNVVSNMRLENSIQKDSGLTSHSDQMIHDFVLEKLQEIVESMQDLIDFDGNLPTAEADKPLSEKESHPSVIEGLDNKAAKQLVSESLRSVVSDIKDQKERELTRMIQQSTSTSSLEAEAIVVETLHNIITEYEEDDLDVKDSKTKNNLLTAMEGISKEFKDWDQPNCRLALEDLFRASLPPDTFPSEERLDDFIESTLDMIVENIRDETIKPEDVYRNAAKTVSQERATRIEVDSSNAPKLSAEEMAHLTAQVLGVHDGCTLGKSEGSKKNLDYDFAHEASSHLSNIAGELEMELLRTDGIDPASAVGLTSKLSQNLGAKAEKVQSSSSISSAEIAVLVKDVLSKIADSLTTTVPQQKHSTLKSEKSASSIPTGSESKNSCKSNSTLDSGRNVNPNAMKKQLSVKSMQTSISPSKKSAPVAIIHSTTYLDAEKVRASSLKHPSIIRTNTVVKQIQRNATPMQQEAKSNTRKYYRIKDNLQSKPAVSPAAVLPPVKRPDTLPSRSAHTNHQSLLMKESPVRKPGPKQSLTPMRPPKIVQNTCKPLPGPCRQKTPVPSVNKRKNDRKSANREKQTASPCLNQRNKMEEEALSVPELIKSLCGSHKLTVKAVPKTENDI
ncbi:hypothetical protein FSP39_024350 [Pinctada imbricata]|uniref:Fibrous sheath-interacting protein 2 n=1 Tax=Pinctada imbricata TaxID=66713 RepID=A0AA88YEX1_PINIB|nr:hypothetical protein FSP39_024350 [Pinctada imbricata]